MYWAQYTVLQNKAQCSDYPNDVKTFQVKNNKKVHVGGKCEGTEGCVIIFGIIPTGWMITTFNIICINWYLNLDDYELTLTKYSVDIHDQVLSTITACCVPYW
jgi:hypothetical protein